MSNSLAERARSSSSGGRIFSFTSLSVTSTVLVWPSPSAYSTCLRLARGHADERLLDLFEDAARPELDRVVALRLAAVGDEVDDERVARLRGALDGRELGDREAERLDLLVDELGGHLDVRGADLEALPVRDLDLRLDVDGRGEAERLGRLGGKLVVVLRPRDRPDLRPGERVPEPALDVALDRLAEDALLPDPGDEHLLRHLALPEPVDLDGRGEVGRGVLDRVLELVRRHVDREANLVVGKLFDARGHQGGIVAVPLGATAELCGWRDSNPHGPKPTRS